MDSLDFPSGSLKAFIEVARNVGLDIILHAAAED